MNRSQHNDLQQGEEPATVAAATVPAAVSGTVHELLRCVSTGYPDNGARCHAHVPASAAREAWRRETLLTHRAEGFFHFIWRGGQWLGYGSPDGNVRGVYCATHCSERRARVVGEQARCGAQAASAARPG